MNTKIKLHIISKVWDKCSFGFMSFEDTKEVYLKIEYGYGSAHACECILFLSKERRNLGLRTYQPNDSEFLTLKNDKPRRLEMLEIEKEQIFKRCAQRARENVEPKNADEPSMVNTFLSKFNFVPSFW